MFTVEGAMKKLLMIIPFAIGSAACVPVYGANAPQAVCPPFPRRAVCQPQPRLARDTVGRWDNVMMLPPGAQIAVVTNGGRLTLGNFMAATNAFVRIISRAGEVEIPAESVVWVDLTPGCRDTVRRDALVGGALGAGIVGLMGLAGGKAPLTRLFAAGAIFGAYESVLAGREVNARSSVTIYVAPSAVAPGRQ